MRLSNERRGVSVIGVGATPQGRHPGRTGNDLSAEALILAMEDAGVDRGAIDGLITCKVLRGAPGDGLDVPLGKLLGIDPAYSATLDYGTCNFSVHLAAMVIESGLAETVALTYGTVQGTMMGASGFAGLLTPDAPYGAIDPMGYLCALMFQRHRARYGVSEEQLGAIAVAQHRWAGLNPLAVRGEELTIEQYLAEPYYINPIRRYDVAPFDDGGVALILTRADRALDAPRVPVDLLGMAQTTALRGHQLPDHLDRDWIAATADRVFRDAGLTRSDIDLVSVQDPASAWTMQMLEHFGFVGPGEALGFIAEGHTSPGGRLPVNTSGGHLAESYMWGWLHTVEVVRQLRGECGPRQVPDAEVAIHTATMVGNKAAATIYGRRR
ncbi:thiolase family protein [Streptomyces sp. NPDC051985]|uniref:thiolase family protein n=1 Tax=Streptomyces sp. NPDC051985 TaxID=3155807 RepID=UPI00343B85BF